MYLRDKLETSFKVIKQKSNNMLVKLMSHEKTMYLVSKTDKKIEHTKVDNVHPQPF